MTDAQKRANAKYKATLPRFKFELYKSDQDIIEHLQKVAESGESKQGYVKRLIREDIKKGTH